MAGSAQRENLAARAGRWSARHWKTAVFGWLGFVFVAFALGGLIGTNSLSLNEPGPGQSGEVQQILNDEFEQPAKELVLVQSSSADDSAGSLWKRAGRREQGVSQTSSDRSAEQPRLLPRRCSLCSA